MTMREVTEMLRSMVILVILACPLQAQQPTPPAKGGFVLPVSPVPIPKPPSPTPLPIIDENTPTVLPADSLYVITNTSDGIVKAVTTDAGKKVSGIVKITAIKGPVTIITKFIYGTGRETRVIPGPFIWIVEAVGPGTVKLLLMPKTLKDESSIAEQLITTNTAPIPPPDPPNPPNPPTPPAPIPLIGFRVLIQYDPATLTADQQGVVFGKTVRDYLQSKCVAGADGKTKDFWIIQKGLDVSAAPKWIGDAIQRHPGKNTFMIVSDGKTGFDGDIPMNADAAMAILTKIGGPL
jgi:hypothetical protein